MKNIIYQLDTDIFPRIRIGIGEKPSGWERSDYVLSRFSPDERDGIISGITRAGDAVVDILKDGMAAAMNKYNQIQKDDKQPM